MVTNQKSSKVVVLITGMISLIYAMANPIIYGTMSMRYRLAYKKVFTAAFGLCERRARSWSLSLSSISKSVHFFFLWVFSSAKSVSWWLFAPDNNIVVFSCGVLEHGIVNLVLVPSLPRTKDASSSGMNMFRSWFEVFSKKLFLFSHWPLVLVASFSGN